MGYIIVFCIAVMLGLCIGFDLGVLREEKRNDHENYEADMAHARERSALKRKISDLRSDPVVPFPMSGVAQRGTDRG
jgi:hypothetical protein